MQLELRRFSASDDDTLGLLFMDGKFVCFTLEDEFRTTKVAGETRIPAGEYEIKVRTEGGLTQKYAQRFPDIHRGMLWLQNVPGFEWIYIHCGNKDEHTDGCILVGDTSQQNVTEDGFIGASSAAYRRIYPEVISALVRGEKVSITVIDE